MPKRSNAHKARQKRKRKVAEEWRKTMRRTQSAQEWSLENTEGPDSSELSGPLANVMPIAPNSHERNHRDESTL